MVHPIHKQTCKRKRKRDKFLLESVFGHLNYMNQMKDLASPLTNMSGGNN